MVMDEEKDEDLSWKSARVVERFGLASRYTCGVYIVTLLKSARTAQVSDLSIR